MGGMERGTKSVTCMDGTCARTYRVSGCNNGPSASTPFSSIGSCSVPMPLTKLFRPDASDKTDRASCRFAVLLASLSNFPVSPMLSLSFFFWTSKDFEESPPARNSRS